MKYEENIIRIRIIVRLNIILLMVVRNASICNII